MDNRINHYIKILNIKSKEMEEKNKENLKIKEKIKKINFKIIQQLNIIIIKSPIKILKLKN